MNGRRALVALLALIAVLVAGGPAHGAEADWTLDEISRELMCPQCGTRLDISPGPAAERIRALVERRRRQGWTKEEVKRELVAEHGERVLAAPPRSGFGSVAWLVPGAVGVVGALGVAAALVVWRRRGVTRPAAALADGPRGDPDADRRLDEALRGFDP